MGGDVQVRSCPGQGCTFTLEVRLEIVEGGPGPQSGTPCPAEEGIAAPAPAAGPLQGLRVLVAEDDAAGRYLLEVRLREQGCTVGLAADGEQVLDMLAAAPWDVILLDAGMPRMDGSRGRRIAARPSFRSTGLWCRERRRKAEKLLYPASAGERRKKGTIYRAAGAPLCRARGWPQGQLRDRRPGQGGKDGPCAGSG